MVLEVKKDNVNDCECLLVNSELVCQSADQQYMKGCGEIMEETGFPWNINWL